MSTPAPAREERELFAAGHLDPAVTVETYTPFGACSGCEYAASTCHAARQKVMDQRGIGRHTSCTFYLSIKRGK